MNYPPVSPAAFEFARTVADLIWQAQTAIAPEQVSVARISNSMIPDMDGLWQSLGHTARYQFQFLVGTAGMLLDSHLAREVSAWLEVRLEEDKHNSNTN